MCRLNRPRAVSMLRVLTLRSSILCTGGYRSRVLNSVEIDHLSVIWSNKTCLDNRLKNRRNRPSRFTPVHLGGFILIDVADHDTAMEIARNIPMARLGAIEVRPVMTF